MKIQPSGFARFGGPAHHGWLRPPCGLASGCREVTPAAAAPCDSALFATRFRLRTALLHPGEEQIRGLLLGSSSRPQFRHCTCLEGPNAWITRKNIVRSLLRVGITGPFRMLSGAMHCEAFNTEVVGRTNTNHGCNLSISPAQTLHLTHIAPGFR